MCSLAAAQESWLNIIYDEDFIEQLTNLETFAKSSPQKTKTIKKFIQQAREKAEATAAAAAMIMEGAGPATLEQAEKEGDQEAEAALEAADEAAAALEAADEAAALEAVEAAKIAEAEGKLAERQRAADAKASAAGLRLGARDWTPSTPTPTKIGTSATGIDIFAIPGTDGANSSNSSYVPSAARGRSPTRTPPSRDPYGLGASHSPSPTRTPNRSDSSSAAPLRRSTSDDKRMDDAIEASKKDA